MNWVRIGIVASLLLCVWIAWPKGDRSTPPRPLLIKSALKQADDPIVILGDSIVRQANLPRTICKRTVVNAGIDGSTATSGLDGMLKKAIGDKKAAMIVVSLGTNDAEEVVSADTFRGNYTKLLSALASMTPRLGVTTVTPLEAGPDVGHRTQRTIDSYNSELASVARTTDARLISIPPMPAGSTRDGVHLSQNGYAIWTSAIQSGIEAALCPGT
ncbi:SGNH/GDSL hydrolase family protein [Tardiphaga alba]|uniref:SGNH/GDSL hydrolase family protein n=1 Tax=Tardiphaga alba TaxID=340268 RepID=A0ABX8AGX7_9BRAD|nr:SGNH/GDSL hydrolase family protein [Tardiphaga alba]QUS41565.1 SGNH/GDSL hydrolase family protein [Tardiphaga alba]